MDPEPVCTTAIANNATTSIIKLNKRKRPQACLVCAEGEVRGVAETAPGAGAGEPSPVCVSRGRGSSLGPGTPERDPATSAPPPKAGGRSAGKRMASPLKTSSNSSVLPELTKREGSTRPSSHPAFAFRHAVMVTSNSSPFLPEAVSVPLEEPGWPGAAPPRHTAAVAAACLCWGQPRGVTGVCGPGPQRAQHRGTPLLRLCKPLSPSPSFGRGPSLPSPEPRALATAGKHFLVPLAQQ